MRIVVLLLCLCGCIIERIDALLDNGVTYVPTSTAEASDGSGTATSTGSTSTGSTSTSTTSTADGGGGSSAGLVSTTTGEVETSGGDASETTAAPGPVCGDGVVEGAESCDDGNQTPGDGCQECAKDEECAGKGAGFVCKEFHCQDPAAAGKPPGGGEIGDPCASQPECTGGWACTEGKCAMCTDNAQCGASTCNLDTGRCSDTGQCQTDDQCEMDEICDGNTCVFSGAGAGSTGPCGLDAVYFGFDAESVGDKQAEQLKALAACITQQNKNVILEAHADDVGTEEYNILLTDRRGNAVKKILVDNGAPPALLQVISKGDLEAQGASEDQRSKERRVQFVWP